MTHVPKTLLTRLLLFVVLPLLLAVGIAVMLAMTALEGKFERRLQEDVEMVARALQRPVSHAFERQRQGSLKAALESALDIGRVYGAYLYDEKGNLLASVSTVHERQQPKAAARLRQRPRGGGQYGLIQGEPVYSYYVPVRLGGDRGTGLLRITRRKVDIDSFMSRLRAGGAAFILVLVAVTTATVVLGFHFAAGAAFERLNRSIDRIRTGDPTHRAEVQGPHEVRSVAEGLNSMLDSIQRAERRIERGREERVELRARLGISERLASIGRLAAGIAHELGTPLGTVAGRVQRLLRRQDLTAPMVRELQDVAAEVRRMERLVREVLDFGRNEGPRRKRIAAGEVLTSVKAAVVDRGDPPAADRVEILDEGGDLYLDADPARIEQALVNLLRNAIQASPGGHVRAGVCRRDDGVGFVVEDAGPGVPLENRERIFEPFFTTRSEHGTGLGLAIVAAVAHEHGGEVTVGASELGGARFELMVPRGPSSSEARPADRPPESPESPELPEKDDADAC